MAKKYSAEQGPDFWISVSDLMAGMIFIFILIISVFSYRYKAEQESFIQAKLLLKSPTLTRHQILLDLQEILKKDGLEVQIHPEEGILRLTDNTLSFPSAKAIPDSEKLKNLGILAKAMTKILSCHSSTLPSVPQEPTEENKTPDWCQASHAVKDYQCRKNMMGTIETVMIEGHTDSTTVREGAGYRDNLALSAARATTVLRLFKLCEGSLDSLVNRSNQPLFAASGYSSLRPIVKDDTTDSRNRRIDIRLVMDIPENALDTPIAKK